jgi:4-hydroxybenzoate polyprenyltransferase/phosphoserine phosphatase
MPKTRSGRGDFVIAAASVPLVVDLDGTLTSTDTLVESVIKLLKLSPLYLLALPLWLLKGRAQFKHAIAQRVSLAPELLPYRESLLEYIRQERASGRRIILATAAHRSIADKVSEFLGVFDAVLASDANCNLKGQRKLQAIKQYVGNTFVYAGDSPADLPIWNAAQGAVLVAVTERTAAVVRRDIPVEREFPGDAGGIANWLRALRVHQWLKNLLLFVPLLTAFSLLERGKFLTVAVAFLAFSLAASANYIVNDLLDLESDRAHPRKRRRPFASGQLSILHGVVVSFASLTLALGLALVLSKGFLLMLLLYLAITSAYSWVLKEYVLVDVLILSILYTLRILAGSVVIGVSTSSWLLSFSVFVFLSLALVKRCAELVSLDQGGLHAARGRDYRVADLVVLWPLGVGASLSAIVVFGLFVSAPETQARYATPQLLWLVGFGLTYWLARLWIKTSRGEMHDDPLVYAIKDKGSRLTVVLMIIIVTLAHFISLDRMP